MQQLKIVSAILVATILAGCGGGGGSDLPAKPRFTSQVSFGDSLSDVGTYRVGTIAVLGGGQFTINAASATPPTPTNWTELTAAALGLPAPCAGITGLDGSAAQGFSVASAVAPAGSGPAGSNCTGYAEGGSRITDPIGVHNKLAGGPGDSTLGLLTIPVVSQMQTFLNSYTSFRSDQLVLVMAGANDVFVQAAYVGASAVTAASAVQAMTQAADDLAADVNTQIIANGGRHVVVLNIPDMADTPFVTTGANPVQTAGLIDLLVTTFNARLIAKLPDSANVLNVDVYTANKDQIMNPGKYLLTNVAGTACNLTAPSPNALGSSLVCNAANLNTGVLATDHYLFSDTVHPTPYGNSLISLLVLQAMTNKGWF